MRVVERNIKKIIGGDEVFLDIDEKKDIITSMLLDPKSVMKKKFVQDFEVNPGDGKQYDGQYFLLRTSATYGSIQ